MQQKEIISTNLHSSAQRRRINTEEKAKAVAAVCGTEFIQFLAAHCAQAVLHYRIIVKNRMNSSFFPNRPSAK